MRKVYLASIVFAVLVSSASLAATKAVITPAIPPPAATITPMSVFQSVNWTSKNPADVITIKNGNGLQLIISITVDQNSAGLSIKNCGTTTALKAGGAAICKTSDAANPVSFSSDNASKPATGTYQVIQK